MESTSGYRSSRGRSRPFAGFFWAGFECATGVNRHGRRIDQVAATGHDRHADEDYERLAAAGFRTARDAIRWPLVDAGGRYDFSSVEPVMRAAERHGVEVVYDLFHFGYPRDLDLFSDDFPDRFEAYCHAAARFVARHSGEPYAFTPVNEPSYFAWAAGDAALFAPHLSGRSWDLKVRLVRAAIRGIDAIRSVSPEARIVNVDPVCRVVAPAGRPDLAADVAAFNDGAVFQSWDLLSGRILPELGGSPEHLGTVGINYYWTNQWDVTRPGVPLADDDPRRAPLSELVAAVWKRYGAELVITETGHVDEKRGPWLREVTREALSARAAGVPLQGVCLYPILGMPEWHDETVWTRMGLWDVEPGGRFERRVCESMREALEEAIGTFETGESTNPHELTRSSENRKYSCKVV
jgi:beta-glucosidase/6-phospho-beta-glucosidase/beta-galactosidase